MYDVDCVIKRNVCPQKIHLCFKIFVVGLYYVLKISVVSQKMYINSSIVLFFDLNHEALRQFHVQIHAEQIDVNKQTNKQSNK